MKGGSWLVCGEKKQEQKHETRHKGPYPKSKKKVGRPKKVEEENEEDVYVLTYSTLYPVL